MMLNFIRQFLSCFRRNSPWRFQEGYDLGWKMIREGGVRGAVNLENSIDAAETFGDYDDFDRGAAKALNEWNRGLGGPQ